MDEPILRATDAFGEVYDDPSEDALFVFLEDLREPGSAMRVERLDAEREGEWARVTRKPNGLYEFDSSANVEYTSSLRPVHDLLTRWAFDLFARDSDR